MVELGTRHSHQNLLISCQWNDVTASTGLSFPKLRQSPWALLSVNFVNVLGSIRTTTLASWTHWISQNNESEFIVMSNLSNSNWISMIHIVHILVANLILHLSLGQPCDFHSDNPSLLTLDIFQDVLQITSCPVSISDKTSYRKISWTLEALRFVFKIVGSLWNLTDSSAAMLQTCLSNFKAMR